MTDLTTRLPETGVPHPAPIPIDGAVVADAKTLRHISRAEQDRLNADAGVERRARAARLELELGEQRRAAARRERQAAQAEAQTRRAARRARRERVRALAPRWAERALFVLPILFPMAVAWVGQIRFAMGVMGWPLPAAIVFAAGFELSTAYVARLDWRSRAAGDSALLFRAATWGFAAGAGVMNYWHAAGPDFAPTGEAVSYGLMSITGVVLWELLSTYRHRTALRAEGKLPAARPRFGLARWIWFSKLTRLAWLLALRDGYTTTEQAWGAALAAVAVYGSGRAAGKAVRAGRPVPRPEPLNGDERDDEDEFVYERDTAAGDDQRDIQPRHDQRDVTARYLQRDTAAHDRPRDTTARDKRRDTLAGDPDPASRAADERDGAARCGGRSPASRDATPPDQLDDEADDRDQTDDGPADADSDPGGDQRGAAGEGAVGTRMLTYAQERLGQGVPVSGAELDRQFGTRDYGRKVLRRLAAGR